MKVSYSMLATWRRCREKFYLSYVRNIPSPPSMGQARGSAGHAALGAYYMSSSVDPEIAIDCAWDTFDTALPPQTNDSAAQEEFESLEQALRRYFVWAESNDQFQPLETEHHFQVPIGDHVLQGYIDMVVLWNGSTWLMEHKFNKRVYTNHLGIDPQVSTYLLGGTLAGLEPAGVIYNIVRMGSGPTAVREPVVRKPLYRNPEGLNVFAQQLLMQAEEVGRVLDAPKEANIYRNQTKDCTWDCPYLSACLAALDDGNPEPVLQRMVQKGQ